MSKVEISLEKNVPIDVIKFRELYGFISTMAEQKLTVSEYPFSDFRELVSSGGASVWSDGEFENLEESMCRYFDFAVRQEELIQQILNELLTAMHTLDKERILVLQSYHAYVSCMEQKYMGADGDEFLTDDVELIPDDSEFDIWTPESSYEGSCDC